VNIADLILQVPLAGGALFVVYMFVAGKLHTDNEFQRVVRERDEYKKAAETERRISTEVAQTGSVTNQLLGAIVNLSAERQGIPPIKVIQSTSEDVTKP
jgi:hypothetical protein